jgi:hypothetical protein
MEEVMAVVPSGFGKKEWQKDKGFKDGRRIRNLDGQAEGLRSVGERKGA